MAGQGGGTLGRSPQPTKVKQPGNFAGLKFVAARPATPYPKLNSLAPDIVEAILAGTEPEGMSIAKPTSQPIPEAWNEQRRLYGFPERIKQLASVDR